MVKMTFKSGQEVETTEFDYIGLIVLAGVGTGFIINEGRKLAIKGLKKIRAKKECK